jgi:hypothetical protein
MTVKQKYVIAGDYSEFEQWIIKNNHSLFDYTYVHDATVFTGTENPHGIFTGSYRSRKDIVGILSKLLTCITPDSKKHSALWNLYYELVGQQVLHSNPVGHVNPVKISPSSTLTINIGHPGSGGVISGTGHSVYRTIYDKL